MVDLARLIQTIPANAANAWIRQAAGRQLNEPRVRFTLPDFLALITMLSGRDTADRLARLDLPVTHLARGVLSQLSPAEGFAALNEQLIRAQVAGATCEVDGFGHQLWHCLPAIDALVKSLFAPVTETVVTGIEAGDQSAG